MNIPTALDIANGLIALIDKHDSHEKKPILNIDGFDCKAEGDESEATFGMNQWVNLECGLECGHRHPKTLGRWEYTITVKAVYHPFEG